jgi:large subunit ribosomal protein L17
MRHGKKLKKLGRTSSHRKSLMMNLAISLFKHERIKTTLTKAKALRPFAEKLITKARKDGNAVHTIRQLSAMLSDKSVVQKLVGEISERFKKRPGGYTRIYKCGFRTNDAAPIALIELVDYLPNKTAKEKGGIKTVKGYEKKPSTIKEKLTSMVKPKEVTENKKEEAQKETKATSEKKSEAPAATKAPVKKVEETKKSK